VEAINSAESIVHDTETKMEEYKDQLPAEEVSINFTHIRLLPSVLQRILIAINSRLIINAVFLAADRLRVLLHTELGSPLVCTHVTSEGCTHIHKHSLVEAYNYTIAKNLWAFMFCFWSGFKIFLSTVLDNPPPLMVGAQLCRLSPVEAYSSIGLI